MDFDEREPLLPHHRCHRMSPADAIIIDDGDDDDVPTKQGLDTTTTTAPAKTTLTVQQQQQKRSSSSSSVVFPLVVFALGFLACCVGLASVRDLRETEKNGLGKRINAKNLSWRADEKMESVERVTNPGGRRSKKKDTTTTTTTTTNNNNNFAKKKGGGGESLETTHTGPPVKKGAVKKVTWELSEYASKDGTQESERKKTAANLVDALKENHVVKEDKDYERPARRERDMARNKRTNAIEYLGASNEEYAWEPPADLPENFDVREKWPECSHFIGEAWDQGECGSCWAIAPTKVMSDRLCIVSGGQIQERLSASEILSCGRLVSEYSFGTCEGGMPDDAYEFAKEFGVASGGKYGDKKGCAAYPFPPCHHPCQVQETPQCRLESDSAQCQGDLDEHTRKEVAQHIDKLVHCPDSDYDCMAREIYNSGPVSSYAGTIYDEFYAYKDGAYRTSADSETRGRSHGGHVIEVVGWHKESDGTYSWKIINSWLNWGDKGHGRVAVGELSIGDSVESATMLADTNVA